MTPPRYEQQRTGSDRAGRYDSRMSDSSAPDSSSDSRGLPRLRDRSWLILAGIAALAVAAIALSIWALLRPAGGSDGAATYSDAQRAEAKAQVCGAFNTVREGVARNTHLQVPGGEGDVAGTLGVAANARISMYDGGQYLLARLAPATPTDLADAVRGFGNGLMDIGAAATAGAQNTDAEQAKRLTDAEAASTRSGSYARKARGGGAKWMKRLTDCVPPTMRCPTSRMLSRRPPRGISRRSRMSSGLTHRPSPARGCWRSGAPPGAT